MEQERPREARDESGSAGTAAVVATGSGSSGAGSQPSGSAGIPPAPRTEKLPTRSPLLRAAQRSRICEAASRKFEGSVASVPARFTSGLWISTVPESSGDVRGGADHAAREREEVVGRDPDRPPCPSSARWP